MQTEVELTEEEAQRLTEVGKKRNLSLEQVVALAISQYVEQETALDQAFGLWKDRSEDGLAYQEGLRAEWGDR